MVGSDAEENFKNVTCRRAKKHFPVLGSQKTLIMFIRKNRGGEVLC